MRLWAGALFRLAMLVALWLAAYKSADIFGFFKSFSSLWFLPAGATVAIVLAAPGWLKLAPLLANLLLALPEVCRLLGVPFTNFHDPVIHALRLYAIYGGLGFVLSRVVRVDVPPASLRDMQWVVVLTVAASAAAALSGVTMHVAVGNMDWPVAWSIVVPWAIGDAIGAMIVPPLLVPLLLVLLRQPRGDWTWPTASAVILSLAAVGAALCVGMLVPKLNPALGSLWYLVIIPPVLAALRGGLPMAAISVFLTNMLTPPAAYLLAYEGERTGLQLLLLIASVAGLLVGAAISDRRRAFTELDAQRAALEDTVAARTHELAEAYEFQRHLVRSIGHDLRQPVQSMNLMLEGLALKAEDTPSAVAIRQTREMGAAASDLLGRILDYARLDAGKVQAQVSAFNVSRLFDTLERLYAPVAAAKGVRLVVERADAVLSSDEQLVLEALSNYLDNALRLSAPGQTVTLEYSDSGGAKRFLVRDEVGADVAAVPGAAGFGLEIVQRIAMLLGGRVVRSPNEVALTLGSA